MCVSGSETGCICLCGILSMCDCLTGSHTWLPESSPKRLVAVGIVKPAVCLAVSDCVSLPTRVCLGPQGHLAPFLGWLAGLEATVGQDRQVQR